MANSRAGAGALRRVAGLVVPIAVAAAGLSAAATAGATGASTPAASAPSARPVAPASALTECRIAGVAHRLHCGTVLRPLDPARPDGLKISIHYVVAPALARHKREDAVFFLAGGPGQSAITVAPSLLPLFSRIGNRRDIVFVDQRGTGRSMALTCDEARQDPLSEGASIDTQVAVLTRCREALSGLPQLGGAEGLKHFTTTVAMQDLDAVRQALGFARINLIGASYGTRAALEYLRQFPQAVRRTVLDGVAPPDMVLPASYSMDAEAALESMLTACEREPACARNHPSLRATWKALLASLPKTVVVADAATGQPTTLRLTRDALLGTIRGPLYVPVLAAALPSAIEAAAAGRFEALVGLASLLRSRKGSEVATGMHFSVVCAEDAPRLGSAADAPGPTFGDSSARLYASVCADWPRAAVAAEFYRIPPSRSPVLLLSGGLDPATPPRHAERVAAALGAMARAVAVPNAGHGLIGIGCLRDVVFRFIDADDDAAALAVDAGCATQIPRPLAFEPVAPQPRAAR